jgi:hypothetical protein
MRVVNALHVMFVAIPQLLIITIHSSAIDKFKAIDIASLVFSCVFILWSAGYYFLCITKEDDYDSYSKAWWNLNTLGGNPDDNRPVVRC